MRASDQPICTKFWGGELLNLVFLKKKQKLNIEFSLVFVCKGEKLPNSKVNQIILKNQNLNCVRFNLIICFHLGSVSSTLRTYYPSYQLFCKKVNIETNPGPAQREKLKTIDQYNKEKNRTDDDLMFWYMNCRSLKKYKKLSNFLRTPDQLSFLAVTETWIKENNTRSSRFFSMQ